jgi:hypothetical protein
MSLTTQGLTAISHLGTYLEKLLIPVNLTFFYSLQAVSRIDARIAVVLLVLAVAAWKLRGKTAFAAVWILFTLLPALAISRVVVPLAERNLYLSSVGFVWLAAEALAHLVASALSSRGSLGGVLRRTGTALPRRDELPLLPRRFDWIPRTRRFAFACRQSWPAEGA